MTLEKSCEYCKWREARSVCGDRDCLGAEQGFRGWQPLNWTDKLMAEPEPNPPPIAPKSRWA